MDRTGRLMTDMSTFMSQTIKNKKFEDLDKKFFDVNDRDLFHNDASFSNFQVNI